MTTLVKRTTLIVRSLERSMAFYGDVLGLSRYYDDEIVLSGGCARISPAFILDLTEGTKYHHPARNNREEGCQHGEG